MPGPGIHAKPRAAVVRDYVIGSRRCARSAHRRAVAVEEHTSAAIRQRIDAARGHPDEVSDDLRPGRAGRDADTDIGIPGNRIERERAGTADRVVRTENEHTEPV